MIDSLASTTLPAKSFIYVWGETIIHEFSVKKNERKKMNFNILFHVERRPNLCYTLREG